MLNHRRVADGSRTISMSFCDSKGESCVLSSAKIKFFFRIIVWFLKKKLRFFECCTFLIKKVVDFLSNFPSFHVILPCFYFAPPTFHFLPAYFRFVLPSFLDKPPSFFALLPHFHIVPPSLPYWECNAFVTLARFVTSSATRTRAHTSRTHRVLNSCLLLHL